MQQAQQDLETFLARNADRRREAQEELSRVARQETDLTRRQNQLHESLVRPRADVEESRAEADRARRRLAEAADSKRRKVRAVNSDVRSAQGIEALWEHLQQPAVRARFRNEVFGPLAAECSVSGRLA